MKTIQDQIAELNVNLEKIDTSKYETVGQFQQAILHEVGKALVERDKLSRQSESQDFNIQLSNFSAWIENKNFVEKVSERTGNAEATYEVGEVIKSIKFKLQDDFVRRHRLKIPFISDK